MLLKKSSKPAHQGFKRKKLDVMGSFTEIKAKLCKAHYPAAAGCPGSPPATNLDDSLMAATISRMSDR
jgi:hypothetical protein